MPNDVTPILKLPLIGNIGKIETLDAVDSVIELPGDDGDDQEVLDDLENALGAYVLDTKKYKEILKCLFPDKTYFETENIKRIVYNGDIKDAPLFTWIFDRAQHADFNLDVSENDGKKLDRQRKYKSAWSNLLLDLGEFHLDEQFNGDPEWLAKKIPAVAFRENQQAESFVPLACLGSDKDVMTKIWSRLDKDSLLVFIDDQKDFNARWGLGIEPVVNLADLESKLNDQDAPNRLWLRPSDENYKETDTKELIKVTVDNLYKKKKHSTPSVNKLIFIVDLLFKKNNINRIKGDNLIKFLREEIDEEVFIIGFTGGQSPFVIDSAVKAGADIVIMKGRSADARIGSTHSTCNPGALFDLLWGLSKNINRMRFLEAYKKLVKDDHCQPDFTYRAVINKLFFGIENESPFWQKYLRNWMREIEDVRLRSLLTGGR